MTRLVYFSILCTFYRCSLEGFDHLGTIHSLGISQFPNAVVWHFGSGNVLVFRGENGHNESFHGDNTARVRKLPTDVRARALDKLTVLNFAKSIQDLRSPPSNHLEQLKGDRTGYHSIAVNKQWRIVFRWENSAAHDVELVDYH